MTISIEPTDFGQDIMDSVSPILGALGLLGADGSLDINGWSLEKALGVFGTYERTEFILNMLSGYLSMPKSVYREITTGLIVKKGELSPNEVREEEWFPISQTDVLPAEAEPTDVLLHIAWQASSPGTRPCASQAQQFVCFHEWTVLRSTGAVSTLPLPSVYLQSGVSFR